MTNIIAYDLGTGGLKAAVINEDGAFLGESFVPYETLYPRAKWCEQRPDDWWNAVCSATKELLEKTGLTGSDLAAVALSGHSLVAAPLDAEGVLLTRSVPIWCDMRADGVYGDFFARIPYSAWYTVTGNGDPPETYSVMKLMWLKRYMPEVYGKTSRILGSKDFINYLLTGNMGTDPSYASGFGVFNLKKWDYEDDFFNAAEINRGMFPEIIPSDAVTGTVRREAAAATGLREGLPVVCGGVDNMCMALGAAGTAEGKAYTSLGSSAWIAVNSAEPVLDTKTRPFVFAHAQKGLYTSAVSIFSAGNSYKWVRETLFPDLSYGEMDSLAEQVPPGSTGLMFNPSLAGGSAQEPSPNMRGAFIGLSLGTTRAQLVRAAMEGVAMALKAALDILKRHSPVNGPMLICGGGSKSQVWRRIFADVYNMDIIKTNVDQGAAALGAAALAANGIGLWRGYGGIEALHRPESVEKPVSAHVEHYKKLFPLFQKLAVFSGEAGDEINGLEAAK
jgi:xylulokinase